LVAAVAVLAIMQQQDQAGLLALDHCCQPRAGTARIITIAMAADMVVIASVEHNCQQLAEQAQATEIRQTTQPQQAAAPVSLGELEYTIGVLQLQQITDQHGDQVQLVVVQMMVARVLQVQAEYA
jgi:hypothetical protein